MELNICMVCLQTADPIDHYWLEQQFVKSVLNKWSNAT